MKTKRLGRTGIEASDISFGLLPVQRTDKEEVCRMLHVAYENGITFYDTARAYSDSEEKFGYAMKELRKNVTLATKSGAKTAAEFNSHLETSLRNLKTDYIDIIQFHNPSFLPVPGGEDGLYDAVRKAKEKGYVRHIGITNHRLHIANAAIDSGLYETVQYPFSYIAHPKEFELVEHAKEKDVGFIAMKALCGGMLSNAAAVYHFFTTQDWAVPIYGMQTMKELTEFLSFDKNPPSAEGVEALIEKDREELSGDFCRACDYCMPCAAEIEIPTAGRMYYLLRRAPYRQFMNDETHALMKKIENCVGCGRCTTKCPYSLDMPRILKTHYSDYMAFYKIHKND